MPRGPYERDEARSSLKARESGWTTFEAKVFNAITLDGDRQRDRLFFSRRLEVADAMLAAYDAAVLRRVRFGSMSGASHRKRAVGGPRSRRGVAVSATRPTKKARKRDVVACTRCGHDQGTPLDCLSCWACVQRAVKGRQPVRTAIVVDPIGSILCDATREGEIREHTERFTRLVERPLDVDTPAQFYEEAIRPGTELVLFDYGCMSAGYGSNQLGDNSRRVVQWAIDHPNALVVIVSEFTFTNAVRYELEERGLIAAEGPKPFGGYADEAGLTICPNIVCDSYSKDEIIPSWWKAGLP